MKKETGHHTQLSSRFIALLKGGKLYPALNGYSAFFQGSGYNDERFLKRWYHESAQMQFLLLMKKGFSHIWLPEETFITFANLAFHEFLHSPHTFRKRLLFADAHISYIDKVYKKNSYQAIRRSQDDTLLSLVNKIRDIIWGTNAALFFSVYIDRQLFLLLLEKEKKQFSKKAFDHIWSFATTPAFPSFDVHQQRHLWSLLSSRQPWEKIVETCQYFLTDYYSARTLDETERFLHEQYHAVIGHPTNASEKYEKSKREFAKKQQLFTQKLRRLPSDERNIASYIQLLMQLRDKRKNHFAKGLTIIHRIAEKFFSEEGIPRERIPFYTIDELIKGRAFLRAAKENLRKREKGFQLFIPYTGRIQKKLGSINSAVQEMKKYFIQQQHVQDSAQSLSGQSTFPGIVRGKARVILQVTRDTEFEKGDILVAGMTRPEYVALMKKAGAIVTDEGGITCHASIISRELKKPCIVGTRMATQMLKNGDLVEVNATKGVCRLLSRAP